MFLDQGGTFGGPGRWTGKVLLELTCCDELESGCFEKLR